MLNVNFINGLSTISIACRWTKVAMIATSVLPKFLVLYAEVCSSQFGKSDCAQHVLLNSYRAPSAMWIFLEPKKNVFKWFPYKGACMFYKNSLARYKRFSNRFSVKLTIKQHNYLPYCCKETA